METQRHFDGHPEYSCLYKFESPMASNIPVRRGPRWLKPSGSTPVLQYDSGPSYDFMAKILYVNTPLFLFNTEFYFPLSSLLVHKSYKCRSTYIVSDSSVRSMFAYSASSWGSIPIEVIFLITMSVMALEAIKFHLFFKIFAFIYFLSSFIRIWEWEECRWFLSWNVESKQFSLQGNCRLGPLTSSGFYDSYMNFLSYCDSVY
jgi:hypothetical protein